ncbi:MAG: ABC transporter ATP-binding protein [Chloroflexi bacterium]|nr:ABC transporter ATP-binding protein [Chloroflexota bacterium]
MNTASPYLLEGHKITKRFGGLTAVHQVDLAIRPGEIVGLIGPNGSGKTTLFNCLSRLLPIDEGKVIFKGKDITRRKPFQVARMGMSRTFQVIRVYRKMTVLENMLISRQWRGEGLLQMLRPSHPDTERRAHELLDFLMLGHLKHELAGRLSGGQRRLLEIGMALMPDPDLLLLDEATSGVNPTLIETIKDRIRALNREQGKAFLLVEHNIEFIADMCERVYVLNFGELLAEGDPQSIMNNEAVIEAYFGA